MEVFAQFLPLILIFVVFYFLLIRPQQQRMKDHRNMLDNLRRGDKIITGGGIVAEIKKVDDTELTVELTENVQVKVLRNTVQGLMSKPEPVNENSEGEKPKKKRGLFG